MARPALPVAVYIASSLILTYYASSLIPALIMAALVLAVLVKEHDCCRKYTAFIVLNMTLSVILCLLMSLRLNAHETCGRYDGDVYVVSSEHKLNGRSSYVVRLPSNAAAAVNLGPDEPWLAPGSTVRITGRVTLPSKATNPGEFDYRDYLLSKGVRYTVIADDTVTSRDSFMAGITGFADKAVFYLRMAVYNLLTEDMNEESGSVTAALYLGDSSLMPAYLRSDFKLTSCSHLIAVSGTHFSGFMAFILVAAGMIDKKHRSKWPVVLFCLAAAVMTGFRESVTRAFVMSICMMFSRDRMSGLSLAVIIMLTADPFAVMSSCLQMSAAACFGILYWGPGISKWLAVKGVPDKISDALSGAAAAHIGLLPFAQAAGIRFSLANLACQIAGSIVVSIICIMFIPVLLMRITGLAAAGPVLDMLTDLFTGLIKRTAGASGNAINCGRYGPYLFIGIFVFALVLRFPRSIVRKRVFVPSMAVSAFCVGVFIYKLIFVPAAEIVFIDVGQGDSCLIITESAAVLIDGGTYEKGETVADVLDWYGIAELDAAFVTHWDRDHCGGIAYLFRYGRAKKVYAPCMCVFDTKDEAYINSAETAGAGMEFALSGKAFLNVLWPYDVHDGKNEDSLVLSLECSGLKCLFTGDIGSETEEIMAQRGLLADCDVLKVSHHGSRFSSGDCLLKHVTPELAVISCGRNNPYGHPSGETLARLADHGVPVRRTDEEGAIRFEIKNTY